MNEQKTGKLWADVTAGLGLLALTLFFFWKITLTNLILVGLDVFTYFYPYREYAAEAWRHGQLPLWTPYLFMGVPFLANIQSATLYPLNVVLAGLSAPRLVSTSIALHVFLAGVFTYAFARYSLRLRPFSSFLAAGCFALGGFIGAQVEHVNQLNVTAWLPLMFLLMDKVWAATDGWRRGSAARSTSASATSRARWLAGLAASIVVALQILAGHTQATYIALFAVGLYALLPPVLAYCVPITVGRSVPGSARYQHEGHSWRGVVRTLVWRLVALGGIVLLGSLLTAAQLLPTVELSSLSFRSGGLPYREAVSFSLRPQLLLQSLLPPFALDLSQVFGESFSEYVVYIGILGLLLAATGWIWGRSPRRHVFALLAAAGLFLALGLFNPVYYLLYRVVPGFALFRAPVRWMLLYSFGVSLLVGYGAEALCGSDWVSRAQAATRGAASGLTGRRRLRWAIAGLVAIPFCVFLFYLLDLPPLSTAALWILAFGLGLGLLIATTRWRAPLIARQALVGALLVAELFVASRGLAYNNPTAPQAYDFLRTAPAHLLTDPGLHRFISMSTMPYDPGDLAEMRQMFSWQLPDKAVYDYIVSAKRKEVLAFNLPQHFKLYAVDGYDGGLLPLRRFVELQKLLLPEDQVSSDGRLREKLQRVPESRLLALLNVKYVVTDKVYDVWIDDVFYDLQFEARLSREGIREISTTDVPSYSATGLGVLSYLRGGASLSDGTPVAEIVTVSAQGQESRFVLRAGRETAEGEYSQAGPVQHTQARVGHHWRDNPNGSDYIAEFAFPESQVQNVRKITVRSLAPTGEFYLHGLSLIDRRTSSNQTVLLSTSGRFRMVHSGDVKIYENLDNLPRSFIVHQAQALADEAQTVAAMRAPSFQPSQTVILAEAPQRQGQPASGDERAEVKSYAPERVVVDAVLTNDGYLVLMDTDYPGWEARVDGQPVPIYRANLVGRAVELTAGRHQVEFQYRPWTFRVGLIVSAASLLLVLVGLVWVGVRSV